MTMVKNFKIAAVQQCSTNDIDQNLADAHALVEQAVSQGAAMVGLPECFSFLGPESEKLERVDEIASRSEAFLQKTAKEFQVCLLGGGFAVSDGAGKAYNRAMLVGPDGALAQYDKMHLFDVDLPDRTYRESAGTTPGSDPVTWADGELGVHGLSICYDVRFPELFRALSAEGAEVLWIPAAFTVPTGQVHWEVLLRARAIENTCYVIAPAQVGEHGHGRASYGHALIIDPWGTVIADAGEAAAVVVADVNPSRLAEVRGTIPSLKHRRM
jgi:predicted amidohydrolase